MGRIYSKEEPSYFTVNSLEKLQDVFDDDITNKIIVIKLNDVLFNEESYNLFSKIVNKTRYLRINIVKTNKKYKSTYDYYCAANVFREHYGNKSDIHFTTVC